MYNPIHPGLIANDIRETNGWTMAQCAENLGMAQSDLSDVLNGRCEITLETARVFERVGWFDAGQWLRMQKTYEEDLIRVRTEPPPVWDDISEIPPEDLPHPGVYIRDFMDEEGLTPDDLANMLGVPPSDALDLINERAPITPEIARALERAGHGRAEHWLLNQSSHDESQALLRAKAAKSAASPEKVGAA